MKKNCVKRYASISRFEEDVPIMNNKLYIVSCISENNWRVLAIYETEVEDALDNNKDINEESNANDWWTSE